MRPGLLDRFIEIQVAVETQDSTGQPIQTWSRFARVYANVESVGSPEVFAANRTLGKMLRRFTIRHFSGITVKHRIVYENQNYDILSIDEIEKEGRHHWLKILGEIKE